MNMLKKFILFSAIFSVLPIETHASLPIFPAEIIGRDLDGPSPSSNLGHVGVTMAPYLNQDAYQVIEVLWEDPVVQTNTIDYFKTRSAYWGSRYGIADRGNGALKLLREANTQKDHGCATYTLTASYKISTGYYDPAGKLHTTYCGFFRCDTFVNWVFFWGGYQLPTYSPEGQIERATFPYMVFNAFPNGNGDGPRSIDVSTTLASNSPIYSINSITTEEIKGLSYEDFIAVVDIPENKITSKGANNILAFSQDLSLNLDKRTFLMDKLGFVGNLNMIPELITLYRTLDIENTPEKNQIIATLQNIYQRHLTLLDQSPNKNILQKFYSELIEQKLSSREMSIALRGFMATSSEKQLLTNSDKIDSLFNNKEINMHPRTILGLKIELVKTSNELEAKYIPNIIEMLHNENNAELEGVFNAFIVEKMSKLGVDSFNAESKIELRNYLGSIEFKYSHKNIVLTDGITMFSYGTWLEATALVNSKSLPDAGKFIANYLRNKNNDEQINYIIGLSNSDFMKKAFENEPLLRNFKKNHKTIYEDTIGIPTR